VALVCCLGRIGTISGAEPRPEVPLRVAVYDVAPYGWVGRDGLFSGLSVELWRRVAEDLHLTYQVTLVSQMDVILTGLERGEFDAAIGAITITPGRLARVDFTYPTHRSGVVVAFPKEAGPLAAGPVLWRGRQGTRLLDRCHPGAALADRRPDVDLRATAPKRD
jgi:ABC-type amino acid transport substrate-binding protein